MPNNGLFQNQAAKYNHVDFSALKLKPDIQLDLNSSLEDSIVLKQNNQDTWQFLANSSDIYYSRLSDSSNIKFLENELCYNESKEIQSGIKHSFSMNFGLTKEDHRYVDIFFAFDKNNRVEPIGFICFSLFLLDSWQVHGIENGNKGIGLCCYINYTFVKSSYRQQGIAHHLAKGLAHYFFAQLNHINQQISSTVLTLTPIIYRGTYAFGSDFLLKNIQQNIMTFCELRSLYLCPCITNVEAK